MISMIQFTLADNLVDKENRVNAIDTNFMYFTSCMVKVSMASRAIREHDVKHHYITVRRLGGSRVKKISLAYMKVLIATIQTLFMELKNLFRCRDIQFSFFR